MTKDQTLAYLATKGITSLSVEHPTTPRQWVLEYLESSSQSESFKKYYKEFIEFHFQ